MPVIIIALKVAIEKLFLEEEKEKKAGKRSRDSGRCL